MTSNNVIQSESLFVNAPGEWSVFDVVEEITREERTPDERAALVARLCAGDSEKIEKVNRRLKRHYEHYSEDQKAALEALIDPNSGGLPNPSVLIGEKVKGFELTRYHDDGNYGYVYEAKSIDGMEGMRFAVKVLKPNVKAALSYGLVEREFDTVLRLSSHYIVKVYATGHIVHANMKLPCHVMEFVDGNDILSASSVHQSTLAEKCRTIIKVLSAAHVAHKAGILHNDFKPDNIKIRNDEQRDPCILDYGNSPQLKANVSKQKVIECADAYRSPYSPPEYLAGGELTKQSDIYSIGVLLKALILEKNPVDKGRFKVPINELKLYGKDKAYQWNFGDLVQVIEKAVNDEPSRRYKTAEAFLLDIKRFLSFEPVHARKDNVFRAVYRLLRTKPKTMALYVVASSLATAGAYSLYETQKHKNNMALTSQHLTNINTHLIPKLKADTFGPAFFEQSFEALANHPDITDDKRLAHLINLATMAMESSQYEKAIQAYEVILATPGLSGFGIDKLAITARYVVALSYYGDADKTGVYASKLFNSMKANNYHNKHVVEAFLESFDKALRYVSEGFGGSYKEMFETIYARNKEHFMATGQNLYSDYHLGLLYFHLAKEIYYSFNGDHGSPSAGHSEVYFQATIKPEYEKARDYAAKALELIKEPKYRMLHYVDMLSQKARLDLELRDFDEAVDVSQMAINYASDTWGTNAITKKAYLSDYVVNRYLDVTKATESIELFADINGINASNTDEWFASAWFVGDAYLNAGKMEVMENHLSLMVRVYEQYKDTQGLDVGIDALLTNAVAFFEKTAFDLDDRFSKEFADTVLKILNDIKLRQKTDVSEDFEETLDFFKLTSDYYNGRRLSLERFVKSNETKDPYTKAYGYADAAVIALPYSDDATIKSLVDRALSNLQITKYEQQHSIDVMTFYILVAKAQVHIKDKAGATTTLANAQVIFDNHKQAFKNGFYHRKLLSIKEKLKKL